MPIKCQKCKLMSPKNAKTKEKCNKMQNMQKGLATFVAKGLLLGLDWFGSELTSFFLIWLRSESVQFRIVSYSMHKRVLQNFF